MSAINEAQADGVAVAASSDVRKDQAPFWHRPRFYRYGFLILILAIWELVGPFVNPIFFSYPSKIALAFYHLSVSGELLHYLLQSLEVLLYGLAIAIVVGIPLAVLMARVKPVDWALDLPINALYATPMVALVPILVLWFGIHLQAKIIVVFLFAVFPILINTQQGAKSVDNTLVEVAASFGVREAAMWRDVIVPSSLPYVVVGLRLGAARAMIGTAVAELYTSPDGLGYLIHRYGFRFDMDAMLVVVLTFTAISLVLSLGIAQLERRIDRWRPAA
jgi:NitT/TauT family transport system permease protein